MTFSEHLLQLRKARGLKQTELAPHIGISWRAYQTYERGHCEPQMSTLIALADFTASPWMSWSAGAGRRSQGE